MSFFEWSDEMSVGVPLIDSDHRALIGFINDLHDALESGDELAVLGETLGKLVVYIEFHFKREEKVMQACGFPHIETHRGEHRDFTKRIHDIHAYYQREIDVSMTRGLLDFLKDWLNHHILIQDKAYARYTAMNPALANEVAAAFGPGLANGACHSGAGTG